MWFLLAVTGYILLAVVFILDKFIVSKSALKPVVYTFYSTIFMFGALLILPFSGLNILYGVDWLVALISGLGFGFGLWTFYLAVQKGETTHISPFNGAVITIFIYLLASFYLDEKITYVQQIGIVILALSSFFLSFEKSVKNNGFHIGFVWALLSGLLFAISHVSAKYLYSQYDFWTAFSWSRATVGFVGLVALLFPVVWKTFRKQKAKKQNYAKKHAVGIVISNKILSVLAIIFLQYAYALGSASLVSAMSGLQFVLMFVLVYLMTKITPKIFKEYFTKRELALQTLAIILVLLGSYLVI